MTRSIMAARSAQRLQGLIFLICWLVGGALAQRKVYPTTEPGRLAETITSYRTMPGTAILVFHTFAERASSRLDRQAVLTLFNATNHSSTWTTTDDNSKGVFTNVALGRYEIEVSAVGYLTAHKDLQVMDSQRPLEIEIVLQRDPSAVNLDVADAIMSAKARKHAKRAIALLKSRNFSKAEKQLREAYELAPGSPDLAFLLGYLYYQKKDLSNAATYLGNAAAVSPRNAQALTLLGRTQLEREDYAAARAVLEQALLVDSEPWLPHSLLADAYLHQRSYDKARDEAELAIKKGRGAATSAQLVLGESLIGLGRDQEAVQVLSAFLQDSPRSPIAEQVRSLITQVKEHRLIASADTTSIPAVHTSAVDPLAALPAAVLSVKSWQPAGIDEIKPATAPGVACPEAQVIEQSGMRAEELVRDVERFAAVEDLFHQTLDEYGLPLRSETRKYNYVASIAELSSGILNVDEYRSEKLTAEGFPDHIASQGFAALALVFHPRQR